MDANCQDKNGKRIKIENRFSGWPKIYCCDIASCQAERERLLWVRMVSSDNCCKWIRRTGCRLTQKTSQISSGTIKALKTFYDVLLSLLHSLALILVCVHSKVSLKSIYSTLNCVWNGITSPIIHIWWGIFDWLAPFATFSFMCVARVTQKSLFTNQWPCAPPNWIQYEYENGR